MFKGILIFLILALIFLGHGFSYGETTLDLEKIVVSKSQNHFFKTYSRDDQDFNVLPPQSINEELSRYPIDLQSRGANGAQADFSLRGSGYHEVLVLLDGQRINDPQTGHHNSDIPVTLYDLEKIEVMPDAGSSLFGPDAIAGAINFEIKKPKTKEKILSLGLGSHRERNGTLSISEKVKDLGFRFSVEKEKNNGFHYDTDFDKLTTTLASTFSFPEGEFNLYGGYQQKKFGAFDFYTPGLNYPSREWTRTYLINSGLELEKGRLLIKPNFLWRRHYDKFMLDETQVRSRSLNHHRTDMFTPSIYFQGKSDFLGNAGIGFEYGQEQITSTNLNRHNRLHESVYFDHSRDIAPKVSISDSLRYDKFSGFSEFFTGSVNLKFKITDQGSLKLGANRSARVPTFTELYYSDPTTQGNSSLTEEEAWGYASGWDYALEKFSYGAELFLREEKHMIDWVKHSAAETKWQAENIAEAKVSGFQSYYKIKFNKIIRLEGNYTYTEKNIKDSSLLYKYGLNYARHLVNTDFICDLPFGTQTFSFLYKKKVGRAGWFLLNSYLTYNLNKKSQVFIKVSNLFNVKYEEIEGIPQPGRWFEAGVKFVW